MPEPIPGNSSKLTAVVAVTPSGVIGRDGEMPWRLSSDLRRFKKLTMGGVLIMGRKTFDSIGKPLPGRETIVITRNSEWSFQGVTAVQSADAAVAASMGKQAFVVGGAQIYDLMLPQCREILLTKVWSNVQGDTHLALDRSGFRVMETTRLPATGRDDVPTDFLRLRRIHESGN